MITAVRWQLMTRPNKMDEPYETNSPGSPFAYLISFHMIADIVLDVGGKEEDQL
jgi:hypothetical protein